MNQNNRICKYEGHQKYYVHHICTLNECDLRTRWCCSQCLQKQVHNHKRQDNSHIINSEEFFNKVMNQYEIVKKHINQFQSSQLQIFSNMLILKDLVINHQFQKLLLHYQEFEYCLSDINQNNFQMLDDNKIKQILNTYECKFDFQDNQEQQECLQIIQQQLQEIQIIIKEYQDNQKKNNNFPKQVNAQSDKKYILQEIDTTSKSYYASSISKNEKYLAYGGSDDLLTIYEINLKKKIKVIKLDNYLYVCQFTQDSSKLYVGLDGGYVHGYDVQNDFMKIYKQQIHLNLIFNLITIKKDYLITCSFDKSIIKTDFKRKKQIFRLTGHTRWIVAIDYNDIDNKIASGSDDKSIILWNCWNCSIIIKRVKAHNHFISQLQLIDNKLNILSLDCEGNLYKWKIDLKNKEIIKLQQFYDQNRIFNFYYINQDKNILLICNNHAKILNELGKTINTIQIRATTKIILSKALD